MGALLLDSGAVQSTVESLTAPRMFFLVLGLYLLWRAHNIQFNIAYRSCGLFKWPKLRSLVLKPLAYTTEAITATSMFLKDLSPSTLQDVTVELPHIISTQFLNDALCDEASSGRQWLGEELNQTLLRFSRPRIVCPVSVLRNSQQSFWTQELRKHFSVLFQCGAFTITSKEKGWYQSYHTSGVRNKLIIYLVLHGAGHKDSARNLTPSPDGKWVATASEDCTVILWDTTNGAIA